VGSGRHKTACRWLSGWVGREVLAWPVWAWAVLGGTEVVWRGRRFWVGMDMRVHEVKGPRGKVQKAE
jgi:ceramide glucosyltransferase